MFVCVFRHGDAPNGPLPPERTNEFQSCCSQRAGSAQKNAAPTFDLADFFAARTQKKNNSATASIMALRARRGASLSIIIQAPKSPQRQINS